MAFTTTITFPEQTVNPFKSPVDKIQIKLIFSHDTAGSNRDWNSGDYNLRVLSYGKRQYSYDLEDPLLVPSSNDMVIGDPDKILEDFLFGIGTIPLATDKKAVLHKYINGTLIFVGSFIEDSIKYDEGSAQLSFTAMPQTDILMKQMILDDENNPTNWVTTNYTASTYEKITDLIQDFYQLLNPSLVVTPINSPINIYTQQDWIYRGNKGSLGGITFYNLEFSELWLSTDMVFFNAGFAQKSVGEALKKLAIDFGCFTGVVSYTKAFFKQLFSYDTGNLQTVVVQNRVKGYRYGLIDYVKVNSDQAGITAPFTAGTYSDLENRVLLRSCYIHASESATDLLAVVQPLTRVSTAIYSIDGSLITTYPEEGSIYSYAGQTFECVGKFESGATAYLVMKYLSGSSNPASGTFTKVSGIGDVSIAFTFDSELADTYSVTGSRDPINLDNTHRAFGQTLANFWFATRGNMNNCRVDKFTLLGIGYDFLADFNYDGSKYQPISMVHHDSQGFTECEAIYLGEL